MFFLQSICLIRTVQYDYSQRDHVSPAGTGPDGAVRACDRVPDGYHDAFAQRASVIKLFNKEYEELAKRNNCLFVDNEGIVAGSDDIHLTIDSHKLLARKIYGVIKDYERK